MNKQAHKFDDFLVLENMAKNGVSASLTERTLKRLAPNGKLIGIGPVKKKSATRKELNAEVIVLQKASDDARMTRVVYLLDLAIKAFGDEKLARKFLEKKHPVLGEAPLAKTDTEWGVRAVEKILNSMIYGLPA